MKQLNVKQRVFIDVINHVPYGSNKMTSGNRVVGEYTKELENSTEVRKELVAAFEKANGRKFDEQDSLDSWLLSCKTLDKAYAEVREAEDWLVENGYLRRWEKKVRFGVVVYYGLTSKGWKVADAYIKLASK